MKVKLWSEEHAHHQVQTHAANIVTVVSIACKQTSREVANFIKRTNKDGLANEWKYNWPGKKLNPSKNWMSSVPLDLRLQNKFRPLLLKMFSSFI